MKMTQLPFLVETVLLLVAMALGGWLGRKGKPYGKVKLGFHLFFFLWFTVGYFFIAQVLATAADTPVGIAVIVMGLALATQIGTGITMLAAKKPLVALPRVHGLSAGLVLLSAVVGFFLA